MLKGLSNKPIEEALGFVEFKNHLFNKFEAAISSPRHVTRITHIMLDSEERIEPVAITAKTETDKAFYDALERDGQRPTFVNDA